EETGEESSRRDQAIANERLGALLKSQGDHDGAMSYYEKSLEIREKLVEETDSLTTRQGLSLSCYNTAIYYQKIRNMERAKQLYARVAELGEGSSDAKMSARRLTALKVLEKLG
ncbi:MAG: tetratricopeptide repeat protein, partial [Firmicutes bacterium]|nr:tetratricopeptide repeat protein [Bacillota bacterium]